MTYSQVLSVLDSSGLSPEQLAPYLGLSNMTLRRWRDRRGSKAVPRGQAGILLEGIAKLVQEERLSAADPGVARLLSEGASGAFDSAMAGMGVSLEDLRKARLGKAESASPQNGIAILLRKIGSSKARRSEVDAAAAKRFSKFRALGRDWRKMLDLLMTVIRSPDHTIVQKSVAYGALFYVIYPFDLIPDHIPILGLTDDFAIITMAASFYMSGSRRESTTLAAKAQGKTLP